MKKIFKGVIMSLGIEKNLGIELREFPRFPMEEIVQKVKTTVDTIIVSLSDGKTFFAGVVTNISQGGLGFKGESILHQGDIMSASILFGERRIYCNIAVCHSNLEKGITNAGLKFYAIRKEDKKFIKSILS